ncbi:hypothetical protein [Streptomyces sp. NPDC026092]|uniref:hypothetical protein n=1 Tax=Streptomyces sp. NPDC026092 TaxID=3154797 RepID=UPI0033C6FF06
MGAGVYVGTGSAILGLLLLAGGVAALRHGWMFPYQRRWIHNAALYGWAQLVMAASFLTQGIAGALVDDRGARSVLNLVGIAALFGGLLLITLAQRPRRTP